MEWTTRSRKAERWSIMLTLKELKKIVKVADMETENPSSVKSLKELEQRL